MEVTPHHSLSIVSTNDHQKQLFTLIVVRQASWRLSLPYPISIQNDLRSPKSTNFSQKERAGLATNDACAEIFGKKIQRCKGRSALYVLVQSTQLSSTYFSSKKIFLLAKLGKGRTSNLLSSRRPPLRSSRLGGPRRPSSRLVLPDDISTRILVPPTRLKIICLFSYVCISKDTGFNLRSIECTNCVFGIARVFKFNEGEAWRVAGHPNVSQLSVFAEGSLNFDFGCGAPQVSHVNLAFQVPFAESWHGVAGSISFWAVTTASWSYEVRGKRKFSLKLVYKNNNFKAFS